MVIRVSKSQLAGSVEIPGSKSHTIRAVAIASLAEGVSVIRRPLTASDTSSAVNAYSLLGAHIETGTDWVVGGVGGRPQAPGVVIDVGNSGTTLYIALGSAALADGRIVFDGDGQIRRRPAGPLIDALNGLGAGVESLQGNGAAPISVRGPMYGGDITLDGSKTSQYLTSLLINCPLALGDTSIEVSNLVEKPYVEMTLAWLAGQGIELENEGFRRFRIPGRQSYRAFDKAIPADFSSATFFLCAAAVTGSDLTLLGLDMNDTQGDKAVVEMLRQMGAKIEPAQAGSSQASNGAARAGLRISGGSLKGGTFDLGNTPDALPALAVAACFAEGETRLVNVAQARLKETDRISVMCRELSKMGADIEELPDGLVIRGRKLRAAAVHGHHDHRVIMALAVAGLAVPGETTIDSAQALDVTFPTFVELMKSVGAHISKEPAPERT